MSGKKICIATPEYPPKQWGGLARTAGKVAQHLKKMGFEVHVACFEIEKQPFVLLDENRKTSQNNGLFIHRIVLGKENLVDSGRELWDCPHTLTLQMMYQSLEILHESEKFEVFHSFFLYPVGYITGLLAKRFSIPHIVTIVGNDIKKYIFSPEKVALCRSGLENASLVAALSTDLVEMADALTPIKDKAQVIYNSVSIPLETWDRVMPQNPIRIGCAGIFKYAKGLPYLLKAVASVSREMDVILELAGELRPTEKSIFHEIVSKTGIQEICLFRGQIAHEQISDWLRSLDIFVLPSLTEGCPNILMEAMASGVPCIATRTGAVEHLVKHGESGLLVPWGDSKSLAEALTQLISDKKLARRLGVAARSKMKEFSAHHEFIAWQNLYTRLFSSMRWV